MGVLLSSCAPNFHSKISFLAEQYKDFENATTSSTSWIAKMNSNYEYNAVHLNNMNVKYCKSKKKMESNEREDENDILYKCTRPKNFPRYDFAALKNEIFGNETLAENNLSVVLMHSTVLDGSNNKTYLPLGTVLNVIYKEDSWLYVQTADGQEGYIDNKVCIPLGIFSLPSIKESKTMSSDANNFHELYSEKILGTNKFKNSELQCNEKDFDLLYLRLSRNNDQSKKCDKCTIEALLQKNNVEQKTVVLVIKTDYLSNAKDTLSVKKGDIVFLIHCCVKGWFWVKNKHNMEGFIPAATAGYWCV